MNNEKLILHIEDNSDNRLLVRRLLYSADYQVLEATNAYEAVSILHRYRPDLILMDINMPLVDGYTLTSKFKTINGLRKIPIIAITANAMRGDREKSLRAGCDGYVEKPIDIEKLLTQIHRFIG
ncbi:MAG: response regulator [Anaerolineaceae bacterium]|jgi:two-component system cell cycle response regulator DivK